MARVQSGSENGARQKKLIYLTMTLLKRFLGSDLKSQYASTSAAIQTSFFSGLDGCKVEIFIYSVLCRIFITLQNQMHIIPCGSYL